METKELKNSDYVLEQAEIDLLTEFMNGTEIPMMAVIQEVDIPVMREYLREALFKLMRRITQ